MRLGYGFRYAEIMAWRAGVYDKFGWSVPMRGVLAMSVMLPE